MKHINILFASGLLVYSVTGVAAEEKTSPWESSAELGYVNVSGNTNTESLKAVVDVAYEVDKWAHKVHADALSSNTENVDKTVLPAVRTSERSAAKWLISGQSDYKFNEVDYFFVSLSYEDDRFSGFDYQAKLNLGYGRRVINTDNHKLKLEIGPGYRSYRLDPVEPPAAPVITETQDETLVRLNAAYKWKITKTSKFTQDLTAELGEDQDEYKSVTALSANINSSLAMKLSYTVKRLDVVPAGNENTDKEAAVTLVYSF